MSSDALYEFPDRPVSIDEALDIRNQVPSFEHTAPLFGLENDETGQASETKAVIAMYIGIGDGTHLFGFNPDEEKWKQVHKIPPAELPGGMQQGMEVLVTWLERQYPDQKFVLYEQGDPRKN